MLKIPLSLLVALVVVLSGMGQWAAAEDVKLVEAGSKAETKRADVHRIKDRLVLSEISPEKTAIASRVARGEMPCELAAHVSVKPDVRGVGRFGLEMGRRLAGDCASADQLIFTKEVLRNPAPSLLEGPVRLQVIAQAGIASEFEVFVAADETAN